MSDIDSPHVVRHNDTSQDDETFFILMDFANIGSLKQYLEWRGGVLNEQEAKIIISQVVKGLAAIRKMKFIHKTLSISDILVHFSTVQPKQSVDPSFDLAATVKNIDFKKDSDQICCKITNIGLERKLTSEVTPETKLMNAKADVLGVGRVFFELLTGKAYQKVDQLD